MNTSIEITISAFISCPFPGHNKMNNFAGLNKAKMIDFCVRIKNTNLKLKLNFKELFNPPQLPEKVDLLTHLGYVVHVIIKKLVIGARDRIKVVLGQAI